MIGPLLFVLYTSDVPHIINECTLLSVLYADDTQIYIQVKQRNIPVAKVRVEDCIAKVKQWLTSNRLRLNPNCKTEARWCISSCRHTLFDQPSLVVDQVVINPSLSVRNLGVQLRADMSVTDQLQSSMTREALRHAACTLVLPRVDYCNSLSANAPATSTKRLQSVINMAARVVSGRSRFDHITDFTRNTCTGCQSGSVFILKSVQWFMRRNMIIPPST